MILRLAVVALPLSPPLAPQLARSATYIPTGAAWAFEPKLDGFRAIVFVDGDVVTIQSRGGKPLGRYFPELRFPSGRYVLDGEIIIERSDGREDFEALQSRIHPAASRVALLAEEIPATFCAFDLLVDAGMTLLDAPFAERRRRLEALVAPPVRLTPLVTDHAEAERWLREAEGVIAKERDAPYRPGERKGMVKIKRIRTIDCVVVGWRPGKADGTVGSLILGLHEPDGQLRVVGHSAGFTATQKRELVALLAPFESGGRGAADPSRWSADRELEWIAMRPELVVEVTFDHASGGRIRHGAKTIRFRDDKVPAACTVDQLDV
jgi:ATP-dependent DNA ligase